jgi:hypothetical protein
VISLPRFQGLEKNRSDSDRLLFVQKIAGAGYDPTAVAAVIEIESARSWSPSIHSPKVFSTPPGYAVGLIQFSPDTAKALGTSSAQLEGMTFAEQLPWVTAFYDRYGGPSAFQRPGDYYVAGFGANPRSLDDAVLAKAGSAAYDSNKLLDVTGDGAITAGDLRSFLNKQIAAGRARGEWSFDVDTTTPIEVRVTNPQGEQIGTASVTDAVAPGLTPLASIYGAPTMVAYPNGWRFLVFAPGVQIPAVNGLPYATLPDAKSPSFGWDQAALVLGIAGLAATVFFGTLNVKPGRYAHAR